MIFTLLLYWVSRIFDRPFLSEKQTYSWSGWEIYLTAILFLFNIVPPFSTALNDIGRLYVFMLLILLAGEQFHHLHLHKRCKEGEASE